jgi:hypothetical protein
MLATSSGSITPRPVFDYEGRSVYDTSGLVLNYPGIAIRDI